MVAVEGLLALIPWMEEVDTDFSFSNIVDDHSVREDESHIAVVWRQIQTGLHHFF